MLCHISTFTGMFIPLGNILSPLIIWLIKKDESYFETEFNHTDATRFPQRIKATALALRETSNFGAFSIFHEKGILIVDRINETLKKTLWTSSFW